MKYRKYLQKGLAMEGTVNYKYYVFKREGYK